MEERRYYFSSFPTGYLLALLEQLDKKMTLLKVKNLEDKSILTYHRIKYLNMLITLMRQCVTERYLTEKKTLTDYGKMLLGTKKEIDKDILKDVFTIKLLENNGLISLDFLKKIIKELDIDHLQKIIDGDTNELYKDCAKVRFDELLFQVDEETIEELKQKIKSDGGRF